MSQLPYLDLQNLPEMDLDEEKNFAYQDVLPSFEMHNYLFNRSVYDTVVSTVDGLPDYSEEAPQLMNSSSANSIAPDPLEEPHLLILNNFEALKRNNAPLKVTLELTKEFPQFGKINELANPLKEYKPGDFIHGCVRIENPTNEDIPFEMFLVSLEGKLTIPVGTTTDQLRLKRRTFLKTFDISACFLEERFSNRAPYPPPHCRMFDSVDGYTYGLPNEKVLKAGSKSKKFFVFRLPETLLDNFCDHSYFTHFKELPPSFGNDVESFNGESDNIEINSALGYGRLPQRGSQIVTKDFSLRGQSIQYSINARLIAADEPNSTNFNNKDKFNFTMIKEAQHYFRFVPIPLERLHTDDSLAKIADSRRLHPLSTSKQFQSYEALLDSKLKELEERLRLQNAGVYDENEIQTILNDTLPKPKNISPKLMPSYATEDKCKIQKRIEAENEEDNNVNVYEYEIKLLKKSVLMKTETAGSLILKFKIPRHRSMKYIVPTSLAKLSAYERESGDSTSASIASTNGSGSASLFDPTNTSVVTPATTPYSAGGDKPPQFQSVASSDVSWLEHIDVDILFVPSSRESKAPELTDSRQVLTAITLMTTDPMPVTIDADFFTDLKDNLTPRTLLFRVKSKFGDKFAQLKDLCSKTGTNLPKSLFHDLLSIINMKITENYIPMFKDNTYKKDTMKWSAVQVPDTEADTSTTTTTSTNVPSQKIAWKTSTRIPLQLNESAARNMSIVPNFENCYVSRFYGIKVKLNFKKYSTSNGVIVPIRVSKP